MRKHSERASAISLLFSACGGNDSIGLGLVLGCAAGMVRVLVTELKIESSFLP